MKHRVTSRIVQHREILATSPKYVVYVGIRVFMAINEQNLKSIVTVLIINFSNSGDLISHSMVFILKFAHLENGPCNLTTRFEFVIKSEE